MPRSRIRASTTRSYQVASRPMRATLRSRARDVQDRGAQAQGEQQDAGGGDQPVERGGLAGEDRRAEAEQGDRPAEAGVEVEQDVAGAAQAGRGDGAEAPPSQ